MDDPNLDLFRRELRQHKIAERQALGDTERAAKTASIHRYVRDLLDELKPPGTPKKAAKNARPPIVAITWPLRGEVDLLPVAEAWLLAKAGRRVVLPVVVGPRKPMIFREWTPGCEMLEQRFGVMVPATGEELVPDALLIPPVAFDDRGYRLGYGSGFYDRTLAAMSPRPTCILVGFELSRCPTIRPQSWDEPADILLTEDGLFLPRDGGPASW